MEERFLENTYFVPMKLMNSVTDFIKNEANKFRKKKRWCDNNLYLIQKTRQSTNRDSVFGKQNWVIMFSLACHKALYSQDWNKLLYLLRKMPRWKFHVYSEIAIFNFIYTRYLLILLMYHPSSQAQGLLSEYLHMAIGCRSDQDKKALLKVLLDLPKKLPQPMINVMNDIVEDSD